MSVLSDWQNLLRQRNDLVGGEVEHVEFPEGVFRGPIKDIRIEGNTLVITNEWTARAPINSSGLPVGGWEKQSGPDANTAEYSIAEGILSSPQDIGGGRVHFTFVFGRVTVFPKGSSRLDPARVRGL